MKHSKIKFVKYNPEHKNAILSLLSYMWHDINENERRLKFEWRYEKNPYREPYIQLAMDGKEVIAFRAFIAQIFICKKKKYTVLSPSDTIVHPDYRRQGIMSKLNDIVIDEICRDNSANNTVLLNTTTSQKSMPVYIKEYWQGTNVLKHFCYRIYPIKLLFNKNKTTTQPRENANSNFQINGYDIVITKKITSKALSIFNEKNRKNHLLSNIRDEAFYDWKYSYQPNSYTLIICKKESEIVAYALIKNLSKEKYSLEEYAASDISGFKLMLKETQKRIKFSVLRSWALNNEDKALLNRCGFFSEPVQLLNWAGKKRFPILVRPAVSVPLDVDFFLNDTDIRKIENWHLQIADRH